ncbi:NADH oxidase [subsurface metagenome]
MRSEKVKILTGTKVEEFIGDEKVRKARLSTGEEIDVGCVLLGIGANPNTKLALDAGLELGKGKGIWVDEYTRTIDPDVFAIGDCAGKREFFTRKDAPVMLASIATAEVRIAGANLYQLKVLRENKGTIGIFSTYVSGLVLGSAGMTETTAKREGFDVISGKAEVMDKHPSTLPEAHKMLVKLIFSKESQALLGGQVAGGISCGELVNAIGIAIQKRFSITELETLQMATHPCLTASPTMYPLVLAAQDATKSTGSD